MTSCRVSKGLMIEALYGELAAPAKARLDEHVRACPECAAEYASLRETLEVMDRRLRPDPGPDFWDGYWDRLSRRALWEAIEEGGRPSLGRRLSAAFSRLPRWSLQAAGAAALLIVGILIGGRVLTRPPAPESAALSPVTAAPSPAVVQAENYVERSKLLLLGLVNFDPATEDAYALDLDRKKAMSRELVAQAPAIRQGLSERGQRRLRELVGDLEVIMMQIANLESEQDVEGVELVKQGVDRSGIFLKIDLDRLTRDAGGGTAPPSGTARPPIKSHA